MIKITIFVKLYNFISNFESYLFVKSYFKNRNLIEEANKYWWVVPTYKCWLHLITQIFLTDSILSYNICTLLWCRWYMIKWVIFYVSSIILNGARSPHFPLPLSYSLEIYSISSNIFFKKSTYFYQKWLVGFMRKTLKPRPESGFEPPTTLLDKVQKEWRENPPEISHLLLICDSSLP